MNFTTGTIISGTHRPIDLIPAFIDALTERDEARADALLAAHPEVDDALMRGLLSTRQHELREDMDWMLEDLYVALDDVAPMGYHFGAHEGDGADFGFWEN